jgi:hypothetical protein
VSAILLAESIQKTPVDGSAGRSGGRDPAPPASAPVELAVVRRFNCGTNGRPRTSKVHAGRSTQVAGVKHHASGAGYAILVFAGLMSLAGCGSSPTAPPPPSITSGGQPVPAQVRRMLSTFPPMSRPAGPVTVSAALSIKRGRFAHRRLVLVAYSNARGQCVEQTYLSAVGSFAYGGLGLTGGGCQGCSVCVAARDGTQLPEAVAALVTDRADTLRVTFATGAQPTVFHHDYRLRGPRLATFNQRVFMIDPPDGMIVLSLEALNHRQVIARENIAGLV